MGRYQDGVPVEANADTVDGEHAADIVTDARVKAHFPDTTANVLSDHDKAAHDALLINADQVDGEEAADIVTDARVKAHFPDTTANVLSDHNKAAHDALLINADQVDGEEAADIVTDARVKAHFPDTTANVLSDHDKAAHDALGINADQVDGKDAANTAGNVPVLDAAAKMPTAQLGGAGATGSNFLRGDQTWAAPSGAGPALQGSVAVDPPSITKASTSNVDVAVTGILTSHVVWVQCQSDLEHGLMCIAAYCPTNGTLRVRLSNLSSSAIDGASRTWAYQAY